MTEKKIKPSGSRRRARALVLQALFETDAVHHNAEQVIERLLSQILLTEDNAAFARKLVSGVAQNRERIDKTIRDMAPRLATRANLSGGP